MKYIIKRMETIDGKDCGQLTEQYNSIGCAISYYELYKDEYKDFARSECFVTRDKVVFKARNKVKTVTITFEVVA